MFCTNPTAFDVQQWSSEIEIFYLNFEFFSLKTRVLYELIELWYRLQQQSIVYATGNGRFGFCDCCGILVRVSGSNGRNISDWRLEFEIQGQTDEEKETQL
jgi:hypothetical protein